MEFNYRDNLPDEIKNWAYVTNLGENANIGTHWIALYSSNNKITYFDNFGAKHMSKKIKEFIKGSTVTTNSFRIEVYVSIMRGYYWSYWSYFILKGKSSGYFTNLFSPNNFKDNLKQY